MAAHIPALDFVVLHNDGGGFVTIVEDEYSTNIINAKRFTRNDAWYYIKEHRLFDATVLYIDDGYEDQMKVMNNFIVS